MANPRDSTLNPVSGQRYRKPSIPRRYQRLFAWRQYHTEPRSSQGVAGTTAEGPHIADINITPFLIGNPAKLVSFPESDLSTPANFRSRPQDIVGIDQAMVANPNVVLQRALAGKTIKNTVVLDVSSDTSTPVFGGGVANTAFLQGSPNEGPNAQTALVKATFWIETVQDHEGGPEVNQLQYTQTVLLNFNGLSWPHVTVATLRKAANAA
jgi:hypothetical protein